MKRLTVDTSISFCDIAQCREMPCPYDGACDQRRCYERLREYERTGLTPEDLKRAFDEEAVLKLAGQVLGVEPSSLRGLASRWISVERDSPRPGTRVLVTDGVFVGEAYRTSANTWRRYDGVALRDCLGSTVTHWMLLPEPPKGEDDG